RRRQAQQDGRRRARHQHQDGRAASREHDDQARRAQPARPRAADAGAGMSARLQVERDTPGTDLGARLPALSADAAAVLRALFAQSVRRTFDVEATACGVEWTAAPAQAVCERAAVTLDGHAATLCLETTQPQPIGELDWSDYAGAARLTAWTLAHERALARLA